MVSDESQCGSTVHRALDIAVTVVFILCPNCRKAPDVFPPRFFTSTLCVTIPPSYEKRCIGAQTSGNIGIYNLPQLTEDYF
jgi:hypothetical protein